MERIVILLLLLLGCSIKEKKPVREIAKISVANLKGQETLYREGWLLIPSAEKSLQYSYDHSIVTARDAYSYWLSEIKQDSKKWVTLMGEIPADSLRLVLDFHHAGKETNYEISKATDSAIHWELETAQKSFASAYANVLQGSVYINKFTKNDRNEIKKRLTGYQNDIKSDLKNMKEMTSFLKSKNDDQVFNTWKESSDRAAREWGESYRESAEQENTLMALPYVIWGNLKALWYGVFSPAAEYTFEGGQFVARQGMRVVKKGVLLPVGGALVVSGRTVWNTGGALFYTGKMGIKVVSKHVEAGLLTSMGLLATASVIPTYLSGKSLGFFTQVGMQSAGVGVGAASGVLKSGYHTAHLSAKYLYNTVGETGKVVFGGAKTGVVLGYNALTALPAQILLTTINAAWFLVWDGPRLALYSVQGKIADNDVNQLPVGSVIDLEQAKLKGLEVKEIEIDDDSLQQVLKKLPKDLKGAK